MSTLRRLLAAYVRGALVLALAAGACGCRTCPAEKGPIPSYVPGPLSERYPLLDTTVAEGLAAALCRGPAVAPACGRPLQVLSISGGVAGVPHSAGVLVGWSASGTRPTFDVVNGISSGSLVGAYAFLGPKYDARLQQMILTMTGGDLIRFRPLYYLSFCGAFGSAAPLERVIERAMDEEFMADLRQAHAEGRRLFIGTMNLRTKRLTVWDLGAIACSGRPDADCLVRKVLLAAVSWPGAMQPVAFDMEVNGHHYREEHCDAGSVAMAFVRFGAMPGWPPPCAVKPGFLAGSNLYLLVSRKLYSDPEPVCCSAFSRLAVSFTTLFEALTRADVNHLYSVCAITGMRFHVLALPAEFHGSKPSFSSVYPKESRQIFEMGYQAGVHGPPWRLIPPGAGPGEDAIPCDAAHIRPCP